MREIDCSGLSCPIPVVNTKKALKTDTDGIDVIVDAAVARENVSRFAEASGYNVSVEEADGSWKLKIRKK